MSSTVNAAFSISRSEEGERSPSSMTDAELMAMIDSFIRRVGDAQPDDPDEDLLKSVEFLALNVEASLRGLPNFDEAQVLPGECEGSDLDFTLEIDRRRWLSTTKAGRQVQLVCGWRAISAPTEHAVAELFVPARLVIVGGLWSSYVSGAADLVRYGLERLLRFVDQLEEVGRGDAVATLGLSRGEIEAALATLQGRQIDSDGAAH